MLSDSMRRSLADLKVRIYVKSWGTVKLYVSFYILHLVFLPDSGGRPKGRPTR